ncbi:MAG: hypothetical protein CBB68_11675 [Rhodospirillaceae bacterium TMED8]|nr:nucleotidyltransferase [Magnetovibrio sp.]OUT49650.1 MAG: hypothetical protein CBB68_11675 [Rhodospirillaceae bacterium TMED8]
MVAEEHGQVVLKAINRTAEASGLQLGLPLADACALCPTLQMAPSNPKGDLQALANLNAWCGRYTPWTALDSGGYTAGNLGLWLDISGCAHLFGNEDTLLQELSQQLATFGYVHRIAVADTPGAAWAMTRFAQPLHKFVMSVPSGRDTLADHIAPLSVAALRLPSNVVEMLFRLGLRRIGQLFNQPRAPLTRRFGDILLRRLDQALGTHEEIITPSRPPLVHQSRLTFVNPLVYRKDIEAALDQLLDTLCGQLAISRLGVRQMALRGFRVDGGTSEIMIGTSKTVRSVKHLRRLFEQKLNEFDTGFGVDTFILTANVTSPLASEQSSLKTSCVVGHGLRNDKIALTQLLDRLANRVGPQHVRQLKTRARHLPERSAQAISALTSNLGQSAFKVVRPSPFPRATRPLQLLACPELIKAVAPIPDHPPVMFRWRQQHYSVAQADGPERIAPEWWLEAPEYLFNGQAQTRNYYRVEDTTGCRFWIFCLGLHQQELYHRSEPLKWYMHGFFS